MEYRVIPSRKATVPFCPFTLSSRAEGERIPFMKTVKVGNSMQF